MSVEIEFSLAIVFLETENEGLSGLLWIFRDTPG